MLSPYLMIFYFMLSSFVLSADAFKVRAGMRGRSLLVRQSVDIDDEEVICFYDECTTTTYQGTFDLDRIWDAGFEKAFLADEHNFPYNKPERRIEKFDSPIVVVPNFLSGDECDEIIRVGKDLEDRGVVADLYMNHRLNKDLEDASHSDEARELISEQGLDEEELAADCSSGFRAQLPTSVLLAGRSDLLTDGQPSTTPIMPPDNSIGKRMLELVGCPHRKIAFDERQWINPNKERVMIRDQTSVHYRPGEGVPPHVDGNHVTVLCYLNDMDPDAGGRTIFPEAGVASVPKRGWALMYSSRWQSLLHFAERVKKVFFFLDRPLSTMYSVM
jgi:hypothetical protein